MSSNPFLRPSTKAFVREAKTLPHYSRFDFLHGYIYTRWPYFYIAVATGEHPLARVLLPLLERLGRAVSFFTRLRRNSRSSENGNGEVTFADTYHGKVVPLNAATRIVSINRPIPRTDLEHVIPYTRARELVVKNPHNIAVLQCPCRAARKKSCSPGEVCLIIGEPFAGFVAEHHPTRARRITSAEAVEILRTEDERGHVHHAFFKDAMLGRMYAICNCCRCCCGAMQAHRNGTPMLASSGYVAKVDVDRCVACGTCAKYCQFDAVSLVDGRKVIEEVKCMGCGVCIPKCKHNALALVLDPARGVPFEIDQVALPH
ncbi:MAG: 4Fe-4S ferredoxin [Ignavibacteria bacterium]|nr:4Fe-4S ferredoxin [Ignavibacteria bacterium]